MSEKWDDLSPEEKAEWFDNSIKHFQGISEKKQRELIREASENKRGMKRHKKRRWWNL